MRSQFIIGRRSLSGGGIQPSSLLNTATQLAVGSDVDLNNSNGMPANPNTDGNDVQWMTVAAFLDADHNEIQYMGKPASNQDLRFRHYVFNLSTETWKRTLYGQLGLGYPNGHIFQAAFDYELGDYYFQQTGSPNFFRFNRASWESAGKPESVDDYPSYWGNIAGPTGMLTSAAEANGMVWHPNCFGSGDKGFVVLAPNGGSGIGQRVWAYCPGDTTWYKVSRQYYNETAYGAQNGGGAFYCPGANKAVVGTGDGAYDGVGRVFTLPAGSSRTEGDFASYGVATPIVCKSGSGSGFGKMVQHPTNKEKLLILRVDTGDVYESTDYGVSWSGPAGYTHPFHPGDWGLSTSWTVAVCFEMGVIIGFETANAVGAFAARMWKPPA